MGRGGQPMQLTGWMDFIDSCSIFPEFKVTSLYFSCAISAVCGDSRGPRWASHVFGNFCNTDGSRGQREMEEYRLYRVWFWQSPSILPPCSKKGNASAFVSTSGNKFCSNYFNRRFFELSQNHLQLTGWRLCLVCPFVLIQVDFASESRPPFWM